MNDLTAIFVHNTGSFNDSDYYAWALLEDLCRGHYHGNSQMRDKYVHHLAII